MKFEFDPKDPTEVAAITAALNALQGVEAPAPKPSIFDDTPDGPAEGAEEVGPAPAPTSQGPSPVDAHGVPFDDNYCGQATDPFYGSGKTKGQWKKKRGVSEEAYNAWYSGELAKLGKAPAAAAPPPPAESPAESPKDTGEFMGWVSEKMANGALTQAQVNEAYAATGVTMADLFAPDPAESIAKVFAELSRVA